MDALDASAFVYRTIPDQPKVRSGLLARSLQNDDFEEIDSDVERSILVCNQAIKLLSAGVNEVLFLDYFCWGGELEYVEGYEIHKGKVIPNSLICSRENSDSAESAFLSLTKNFDIEVTDGFYFKPFVRNFWGIDGY